MSIRVMSAVWANSRHEGRALLLLLAIADHADDHGRAFPSIPSLQRKARLSRATAYRLLQALQHSGELTITARGRHGRASEYIVSPPAGEQLAIIPPKRGRRLNPKAVRPKMRLSYGRDDQSQGRDKSSPGGETPNHQRGTINESSTPPTPRGGTAFE